MGFVAEAAVGSVGRSVGPVGRTGRSDGRTVGGRPGRVRDLNSLLGGFGLVVGLWTCSGVKVDLIYIQVTLCHIIALRAVVAARMALA